MSTDAQRLMDLMTYVNISLKPALGLMVRASIWVRCPGQVGPKYFKSCWFSQLPCLTFSVKKG